MPPKAGKGRGKKLAGKYRNQKRKAEENEDLEVQEDSTESPTREKGRKSKKDVSSCPSKTPERSPEGSKSPQRSERSPQQSERSPQQSQESRYHSPSPHPPRNRHPNPWMMKLSQLPPPSLQISPSPSLKWARARAKKGKGKAQNENPPPGASYSFTETNEEVIARWVESKKLLYDMKDKQYKDKALRRQLWEGKAAEYGVDYDSIQKWYRTQRTRFSKLREGQPKNKSQKRSGDGLSSGEEEDPILTEEASENDSDRDKFIRRVFGFLKPHIRRHKKDTPASFKDKLALAETGELAGSDDSTMADSLADEPREPTKKYTGYPTPRPPSRTRTASEDRPDIPVTATAAADARCCDSSLHICHLLKSRPTSTGEFPPSGTYYSASRATSSPSADSSPVPDSAKEPTPASVWRSKERGYVEQANQQYNLEQQQQQYQTLQPVNTSTQGYEPSPRQAAFVQLLFSLLSRKSEVLGR
ncbi:hypothetical protein BSL78_10516 [Apostichopus japonicus]|uniref:MADF domain-containing protein n=1 Tax=Stichopus japonicus TaxID=307972 RepID=A0A2G8KX39_STIJA|nr:hypothetical protein BSL78_10516 [Apostichopus japonicus]